MAGQRASVDTTGEETATHGATAPGGRGAALDRGRGLAAVTGDLDHLGTWWTGTLQTKKEI